jgi:hypothetical protein
MPSNSEQLETQANAVHGFRTWLASDPAQQTTDEITREFNDQLLHVLQIYENELDRILNCEPATQDWFNLVALDKQLAELLQEELLELYPELAAYRPSQEPKTVHEMIARLLTESVEQFEVSQHEMSTYLERPLFPKVFNNLLELINTH